MATDADAQMTVPPTVADVVKMELTIRCALQSYDDVVVSCPVDWSVKKLKQHLNDVYPSQPDVARQRLIFCGRILEDDRTVKSYIETQKAGTGSTEYPESQVIQLVVPKSDAELQEGLRRRRMNANNASNATQSNNNGLPHATATVNGQTFQYSFTGMQGMYGYPGQATFAVPPAPHTDNYARAYAAYMQQYYQNMMMMYAHSGAHIHMPTATINPGNGMPQVQAFPGNFMAQQQAQQQENGVGQEQAANQADPGVVVVGGDEPHQPRDLLSVLYKAFQLGLLIMVVFTNSSMSRCFVVFATILFVWFLQNRRGRAQQDHPVLVQQPHQTNEEGTQNEGNVADVVMDEIPTAWNVFWTTCYTFISSFFASLLPDNHLPLEGN